ncbi:topless-related protein 4-like [Castanea sativa]|uniref:topless-related protein 4-like n=1 Tax=Castanea sativa TaxID=21020 RepID=UPI003F64C56C
MVNDLAFSNRNRQLSIISCGEDRTIKVWDAVTGNKLYTLEGHEAPVYSVCPHPKFIISVDIFTITAVQELTMSLGANLAREWPTALTGHAIYMWD